MRNRIKKLYTVVDKNGIGWNERWGKQKTLELFVTKYSARQYGNIIEEKFKIKVNAVPVEIKYKS